MIPAEAVEAAWDKLHENPIRPIGIAYAELEAALEAAAPHMLAGRTIATIEELSELPGDTIVLDAYGVANQLSVERITEGAPERLWNTTGHDCNAHVTLPATVLWEPTP